jgi:uncharacterized protein YkwD
MAAKSVRALALGFIAAALAGCADTAKQEQPSFYQSLAQPGATLDANAAASMISGYRANNGLAAVSIDPALMRLAEAQAQAMAARDRITHNTGGAAFIGREHLRRIPVSCRGGLGVARFSAAPGQ